MTVYKWNGATSEYVPHSVPDDWNIMIHSHDMDKECNCVNCGAKMKFGSGYTSLKYHNSYGMGYMECPKCYFHGGT